MILGSGLSMVDAWLTLAQAEHRGPIFVLSRNGFLPTAHRNVEALKMEASDIPFEAPLLGFLEWFRARLAETAAAGGDWRSVVDGLRPFNQRIWCKSLYLI